MAAQAQRVPRELHNECIPIMQSTNEVENLRLIHWLCANVDLGCSGKTRQSPSDKFGYPSHPTAQSIPTAVVRRQPTAAVPSVKLYSAPDHTSEPSSAFSSGSAVTAIDTIFLERSFLNINSLSTSSRRIFLTHYKITTFTKMSHTNNFKSMLTIAVVVGVAFAAPNKDKSEQSNEIVQSGSFITNNGDSVSASWGGFHAAASLADDGSAVASAGGNGLGASTGYGPGGAGAGASVGSIGANEFMSTGKPIKPATGGYGNSGKPEGSYYAGGVGTGIGGNGSGGVFDRIFAIPINVLQSVNTYLNNKQMHQGQPGVAVHGQHQNNGVASASASASAVSGSATYDNADKAPVATVGSDYGHQSAGASGNGKGASMMVHRKTNYDEIFNIPITALRSVQNLLNG
ncbi:hypothetical protein ACI65C_004300 [Semiaphis heraclei]